MKRILMVNEGSHLLTGYATYGNEVLTRLYNTGKYELAEFASSSYIEDAMSGRYPWKFYPNSVKENDPRHGEYKSQPANSFGRWRFERVLLDFKPDIVWDIRDFWMMLFEEESPLRPYFHWTIMPTVDSAPQNEAWIETFIDADSVFTYSDWGGSVLQEQGGGKINYMGSASPGVDLNIFKPYPDKNKHRDIMGLQDNLNIVGTVMRNQKRKLYPDLFDSFAKFIELCIKRGRQDLAQKTFLYAHTSYPDLGWNIPDLLKKYGVCHKVLFTYKCHHCHSYFPAFFQDAKTVCIKCNSLAAGLVNTQHGLSRQELADIYNMFDCYIQYSICEGFGMPQVEAIACGVPLMSVDYSAMTEIVKRSNGYLLKPKIKFLELETGAYRVYPDNDYTAEQLFKFLSLPQPIRAKKGFVARKAAAQYYDWDIVAKIWENHFDNIELKGLQGKWDLPQITKDVPQSLPEETKDMSNDEFVKWLILYIWQEPNKLNSHTALGMLRTLNHGFEQTGRNIKSVSRNDVFLYMLSRANNKIHAEDARSNRLQLNTQDFLEVNK